MKKLLQKIDFLSLSVGIVIGVGLGVNLMNAFVPNANQLIEMYQLNKKKGTIATTTQALGSTNLDSKGK